MDELNRLTEQFILDPTNPRILFDLAMKYEQLGSTAAAINYFQRCSENSKDNNQKSECWSHIAKLYDKRGRNDEEVTLGYTYAVRYNPQKVQTRIELLDHYIKLDRIEKALSLAMESYNLLESGQDKFALYMGYCYMRMGARDEAIKWYQYSFTNGDFNTKIYTIINGGMLEWMPEELKFTQDRIKNLILPFEGSESIKEGHAQAGQDIMALAINNGAKNLTYLEFGAADPELNSNTKLLEDFNWTGISYEIQQDYVTKFNRTRKNPCFMKDARTVTPEEVVRYLGSNYIDYMSLDLDDHQLQMDVLKAMIPSIEFGFITIEHDRYHCDEQRVKDYREFLTNIGYELWIPMVSLTEGMPYEDWFINPVTYKNLPKLKNSSCTPEDAIINILTDKSKWLTN